jgi:predicted transposase/invertase (TIGR01784 family)
LFGYVGNEAITQDLISSVLGYNIENISLKDSTILEKDLLTDKLGILDIKATLNKTNPCDIEMQVVPYENLEERILFYWSKMYASQIQSGQKYTSLNKTIVILFTNHKIKSFKNLPKAHSKWHIREDDFPKFVLTSALEVNIIEIPKLMEAYSDNVSINKGLAVWAKFILNPNSLEESEMNDNENIKDAKQKYDEILADEHEKELAELRLKYIMDEQATELYGYNRGLEDGEEKGKEIGKIEIVKKMLLDNKDFEEIMKYTDFTKEEILKIQNENN